ncbi:MAG TPA: PIG-L family deacetylase [Candidatus Dormibacteraeota bacterium]|nr:PIG-L family deacetylase [Candidatus Dormibacteraeota bacterium]
MKFKRIAGLAAVAGALALGMGLVARRVVAQPPWAVSIRPETRLRPIAIDRGAAALWQSLLKLHTRASMLMIDAHPDDEDGGLLAYESRGQGARVALLTLNRGESGQNLMGSDLFDALGLVRTEELLDADQYYGSQQYFTPVIDFGFSKSKEETLQKWGHRRTLAQVVRVIRMVRPLVLTSVFVGGPSDGHGHHQASGEMAQEAFSDAGNPHMFPEQIRQGLRPWTPLKDYARVPTFAIRDGHIRDYADGHTYPLRFYNYVSGKWMNGMLSADLTIPEGRYDPLLGGSFLQIGREGLGFQKSQTGGITPPPPGPYNAAYHLFGSRVHAPAKGNSMFAGIDVSLAGIADLAGGQNNAFLKTGLAKINRDVEQAMRQFDERRPDAIAPLLAAGAKANLALIDQVRSSSLAAEAKYNVLYELRIKQAQFNTALAESLGLSVRASVTPDQAPQPNFGRFRYPSTPRVAIPGETIHVSVRAADQNGIPVAIERVWIDTPQGERWSVSPEGKSPSLLGAGQVSSERFQVRVAEDAKPTRPYFSRASVEQNNYTIDDPKYLDLPFAPYPVSGWVEFEYEGVPVRAGQVAQTFQRETGFGDVPEPLVVAPAISLRISPRAAVVPLSAKSFPLSVLVHSNIEAAAQGTVRLDLPAGWDAAPAFVPFSIAKHGQDETIRFTVRPASLQQKPYELHAVAMCGGRRYTEGYEQVGYPGLRPYYLYRPANYETTGVDVKIAPGLKVGFLEGTGSQVPESLVALGVHTTSLNAQEIASGDLARFNAIIIGVRAYSVQPALATYNQRLLAYVHQGGTLIVQYQAGTYNHNYGPYPLEVNATPTGTVTNEDSAVQFLLPDNPALRWPNRIGEQDFAGWVEERGHSFAASWDPHWKALVEMHDPGQAPQRGGLLIARYGKGEYVYEALALYRQLPAGVPGSYRIMANLLSLSANPARGR